MNNIKKIIFVLSIFTFIVIATEAMAQKHEIKDQSVFFDGALKPSLAINTPYNAQNLAKSWERFMETNYQIELDGLNVDNKHFMLQSGWTNIIDISPAILNMHTKIETTPQGDTEMNLFVDFGNGYFLNPYVHKDGRQATEQILTDFLDAYEKELYQQKIENTQTILLSMRNNLSVLEGNNESIAEEVESMQLALYEVKKDLQNSKSEMATYQLELIELENLLQQKQDKLEALLKNKLEIIDNE